MAFLFGLQDTLLDFSIDDLAPVTYLAETLTFFDLNKFISEEKVRGSILINEHLLVRYKRWTSPLSVFILTIIAVSVSSFKILNHLKRFFMFISVNFGSI